MDLVKPNFISFCLLDLFRRANDKKPIILCICTKLIFFFSKPGGWEEADKGGRKCIVNKKTKQKYFNKLNKNAFSLQALSV